MEVLNVWIAHNGPPIQDAIRVRFNLSGYDLDLVEQALRKPHVVERRLFKVIRSPVLDNGIERGHSNSSKTFSIS